MFQNENSRMLSYKEDPDALSLLVNTLALHNRLNIPFIPI
jgi:hypothetical protein